MTERHEETAIHEYHECLAIREGVWRPLAKVWLAATHDTINVESPLLTVARRACDSRPPRSQASRRKEGRVV